jgi:hypothetical protein
MKFIQKIGLEIEGGWFDRHLHPSPVAKWHRDGSVRNIRATQNGRNIGHVGEVASEPLPSLEAVKTWINDFWPDRKNKSCGFHIHVSVKPELYEFLMEEDFYNQFLKIMEETGKTLKLSKHFFDRLNNQNSYCRRIFHPHEQAGEITKTDKRYTHLNYCYTLHGTLENRLPCATLTVKQAFTIVKVYTDLIEAYLEKHAKPKAKGYSWEKTFEFPDEESTETEERELSFDTID